MFIISSQNAKRVNGLLWADLDVHAVLHDSYHSEIHLSWPTFVNRAPHFKWMHFTKVMSLITINSILNWLLAPQLQKRGERFSSWCLSPSVKFSERSLD